MSAVRHAPHPASGPVSDKTPRTSPSRSAAQSTDVTHNRSPHPTSAPAFRPSTKTRYQLPCHSPAPSYPARSGRHVRITPPATRTSKPAIFPTTETVYAHSPDGPASPCSRARRHTPDLECESSRTPHPSTRPRPHRTSPPQHIQQPRPQPENVPTTEDVRTTEEIPAAMNGRAAKTCERPKAPGKPAGTRGA